MSGKSFLDTLAKLYQRSMRRNFAQFGLKYEDAMIFRPDVEEAVRRLPQHVRAERRMRITRAVNYNCQKKFVPAAVQAEVLAEPYNYLEETLDKVRDEIAEKKIGEDVAPVPGVNA